MSRYPSPIRATLRAFGIALVVLLMGNGCAYFNVFYMAQRSFDRGEKATKNGAADTSSGASYYNDAITRYSKVIVVYPQSSWVDDALFGIGKSYARIGELAKAQRKFDELQANFPESAHIPEATSLLAHIAVSNDDYGGAEVYCTTILGHSDGDWTNYHADAHLIMGTIAEKSGDLDAAMSSYLQAGDGDPRSSSLGFYALGRLYFDRKEYSRALEYLGRVNAPEVATTTYLQTRLQMAECLERLSRYPEALDELEVLQNLPKYASQRAWIKFTRAKLLYRQGMIDQGIDELLTVARANPKTEVAVQAYTLLGDIFANDKKDLAKAKDYYAMASQQVSTSVAGKAAKERSEQVGVLADLRRLSTTGDDASRQMAQLRLAETYMFDMVEPDSALKLYRIVAVSAKGTPNGAQARYAIAYAYRWSLHAPDSALAAYDTLLREYPKTDYAEDAMIYLRENGSSVDSSWVALPEHWFAEAERVYRNGGNAEAALKLLDRIIREAPTSRFTPKALLASVIIYRDLGQNERATQMLNRVRANYPNTPYDDDAIQALGFAKAEPVVWYVGKEVKRRSSVQYHEPSELVAPPEDTVARGLAALPRAPYPLTTGVLQVSDIDLRLSQVTQRTVKLKVQIAADGRVMDAELVVSTGSPVIDRAALKAARETVFDVSHPDEQLNRNILDVAWFLYELPIRGQFVPDYQKPYIEGARPGQPGYQPPAPGTGVDTTRIFQENPILGPK